MHMSGESLLVILLIGAVAGWLAGQIVQGTGFGLIGDIVIGIVGALLAGLLFPALGIHLGAGIVAAKITRSTLRTYCSSVRPSRETAGKATRAWKYAANSPNSSTRAGGV